MDAALAPRLLAVVGPDGLLTGDDVTSRSAGALRRDTLNATLLVRPRTTAQVAAVLAIAHELNQPVVTHGGLTGLVHGSDTTPADLVLSLERMTTIEEIDVAQRVAVVQAGVTLQSLQQAAADHDLLFPLDLGARGTASLGGNVSTNAGGNRVIRYGMTRAMVLGLEVVLADGTIISSMNRMIKNNAAYDLKHLFIGSEGTLGVVTRMVLRLFERPRSEVVAFVAVDSFANVTTFLKHMDRALGGAMSAFEVMWRDFYVTVTTPPAPSVPPLAQDHPYYVLVEAQGGDAERDPERFDAALESALAEGIIADAALAHSATERGAIWGMRDDVMQMMRFGIPFTFDIGLPIPSMERYVQQVHDALRARWPECHCWTFGHLGDGNLHFVIQAGDGGAAVRREVEAIVYTPLASIGGTVSAEHGIGLEKKPYLALSRTAEELALMRTLKGALDPRGILNPGKVV